ncbi:MAG: tetratricopeptide repeat protein, partial [Acidobacteriota bacterium]
VMLYEMLVGRRPFDGTGEALHRKILDETPVLPSQVADPGGFDRRQLVGDLDNIVSTALEKDPKLRYGSIEQLDADLERYATDQPVLARSATWSYRLGKLLRRQRRWVAGLALAFVALVVVVVERERNRQDLERQRDQAIAVQDFLVEVFDQADPRLGHDGRLDVRDVLDQGVERVESLGDQPRLQAEFSQVLGRVYLNLGLFEQARPLLDRSFALHLEHHGEDSAEVAAMRDLLGQLLDATGEHDAAAEQFESALSWRRQERPRDVVAMTAVLNNLALNHKLRGQQAEAVALARENLSLRRQNWGDDHIEAAVGYNNLGYVLLGDPAADPDEIQRLFEQGLALRQQHLGDTHTDVAVSLNNLASVLIAQGDYAGARVHMQDAFEIWRQFLDDDHPDMLTARLNIVAVLDFTGEEAEALRRLEVLLPKIERHFGDETPQVQSGRDRLATLRAKVRGRAREPASDEPTANRARPSPGSDR